MPVGTKIFLPLRGRVGIRSFSSSRARWQSAAPLPSSKPVGAFRGGVFGFLTGSVAAGASVYYYILAEYRFANEMLSDDIASCTVYLLPNSPKMFRVELVSDTSTATPGWSYAPTRGFDPAQAMAPTLGRKRGIRDAGKGGDISSRQANAIARHLAELDRENQRDVAIPAPVKQAREAGARGTRAKTTSNVRRILQSQKTFRNHLDDEEAAIASGSGGVGGMQGAGGASVIAAKGNKAAAVRRSATPASTAGVKRPSAAMGTTTGSSTPAQETTDAETDVDDEPRKPKLIKSEYDNDPLLRSYAPPVPSDRIMQRLLAEPPLSYNASRAKPQGSGRPGRHFCCMCGYWGKIRCKSCHLRTCSLGCYKVHEDSRCGAFF
ncbi:unnamed protein product [Penicillium egyptiacum]|uniref:HIT-type domain-containing protein n=1 Tax=Penicillium egyptiacum TaxID=1303716 RepID=A0A9W4KAZ3_9EURO|nr:unnamed protein product [Penicillium egyptiacum]